MERNMLAGVAAGKLRADSSERVSAGLALLMDELAYGVLVIDMNGRLLHANQAAQHELAQQRVLGLRREMLRTRTPEDGAALSNAMAKAAQGKRSLLTLCASEGPNLTVALVPLKAEAATRPQAVALWLARASVCDSQMLSFFARSHGLTRTEEQVMDVLCQGYSTPEIAAQMNLAVSTVRSHVRSLCVKTRSSGVRELVARVAMLPPIAPALWDEMH